METDLIDSSYDTVQTSHWIRDNNFEKIALQFPDHLLNDGYAICERIKQLTEKQIFISVDTTYSNCCVDEVSAKHVGADAIIHYGHACLSPCNSNVYYVHPKAALDVNAAVNAITSLTDDNIKTIIFFHTSYNNSYIELRNALKNHSHIFVSRLKSDLKYSRNSIIGREILNSSLEIQNLDILDDSRILYIGEDDQTVFNLAVTVKTKELFVMDNVEYSPKPYSESNWFKRRRFVIEKCKDAKNIGILVCTLSIVNFTSIIQRLKDLIKLNGKKSYVLTLGKPNIAKLANVYEIELFVLIACPENDLYMCRDFLQPIAYPYELELALNKLRDQYTLDYTTDFNDLLVGGKNYCELVGNAEDNPDISLITGGSRNIANPAELKDLVVDNTDGSEKSLMEREDWAIAQVEINDALSGRSWKGLEQKLGETPVEKAQKGRCGIASGYEEEPV